MIAIADLGVGNFANVEKALDGRVTSDPDLISRADKIVLPGVGNFGEVARRLQPLKGAILERIESGVPFLGICLGLQLLFPGSSEAEGEGLGLIDGEVVPLPRDARPHIGWNQVIERKNSPLLDKIPEGSFFYFVHSFFVRPKNSNLIVGTTQYETDDGFGEFPAIIQRGKVFGVQFHPEKSSQFGLQVLERFKRFG